MSGSLQSGHYSDGRMMRQVDERDEDMGMDEYGVSTDSLDLVLARFHDDSHAYNALKSPIRNANGRFPEFKMIFYFEINSNDVSYRPRWKMRASVKT